MFLGNQADSVKFFASSLSFFIEIGLLPVMCIYYIQNLLMS